MRKVNKLLVKLLLDSKYIQDYWTKSSPDFLTSLLFEKDRRTIF